MNALLPFWLASGALFATGLVALLCATHLLRKLLAVSLMVNGIFLFMVTLAARTTPADPVLHALVLTGLVISVSATALALVLMRRVHEDHGDVELDGPR